MLLAQSTFAEMSTSDVDIFVWVWSRKQIPANRSWEHLCAPAVSGRGFSRRGENVPVGTPGCARRSALLRHSRQLAPPGRVAFGVDRR